MRHLRRTATATRAEPGQPYWSRVLRAIRAARGVSQDGWAAWLGVSRRTVQRWERGEVAPDAYGEQVILERCQAWGLFRTFERGPLRGLDLTPVGLRDLLAEARLGTGPRGFLPSPEPGATGTGIARAASAPATPTPTLPVAPPASLTNLPAPLTSFVGREWEMAEVARLLATTRLLTLTGAGGVGKTRLALEAAAAALPAYPDGAWLVEFGAMADPALVPQAVAVALGVREAPGRSLAETLVEHLRRRSMLLVLDNCEHLLAACAHLAEVLLRACPRLQVLATSREALAVGGETVWVVPSLTLPDPARLPPGEGKAVAALARTDAVRLLVERARAARPGFALTSANAPAVVEVCQRLDGIPLALELAAARLKVLPVEEVAAHLHDRFRLLTGGSRTALPRHQTLRATMDWSHDLLTEPERALFRRLAAFAGGFTLQAAERVCAGEAVAAEAVLDLLTRLVDKSLVVVEEPDAAPAVVVPPPQEEHGRYRLLETARQYGWERLAESGEAEAVQRRHADVFLGLAEATETALRGARQGAWLKRLEAEHDNLRAALAWSRGAGEAPTALRLAGALGHFWWRRGYGGEGRQWLESALALPGASGRTALRAKVLFEAGQLARQQGDYAAARPLLEESRAISLELGDQGGVARTLWALGLVAAWSGDRAAARPLFEEAVALAREAGDPWTLAEVLFLLGTVTAPGDDVAARPLFEESAALFRQMGDTEFAVRPLNHLGRMALRQGDYATAHAWLEEALALAREAGDTPIIGEVLFELGKLAWSEGDHGRAAALFEETRILARRFGEKTWIVLSLHNLGYLAQGQSEHGRAAALFRESLAVARDQASRQGIAASLAALAGVTGMTGQSERAARLFGAAEALRDALGGAGDPAGRAEAQVPRNAIGNPLDAPNRAEYECGLAAARAGLDATRFAAAWMRGRAMPLDQAIAEALGETAPA
jgi:predicted ATPase/transcriptional regulator with XRE-family HTH domain